MNSLFRIAIPVRQYQGRELPCSCRNRVCKQYRNGTHTKSPNTSIKPKPSVMMSIVVKIASCDFNQSINYGKKTDKQLLSSNQNTISLSSNEFRKHCFKLQLKIKSKHIQLPCISWYVNSKDWWLKIKLNWCECCLLAILTSNQRASAT